MSRVVITLIPLVAAAVYFFGKMVFGGFGRNIFNPAISGRAFIYVSFGVPLSSGWVEPIRGLLGGFSSYSGSPELRGLPTP